MKTIFKLTCFIILFTGCTNVLEEEIVSGITADQFYIDEAGIQDALTAGYARLKHFYGQQEGYCLTNAGTDIYGAGRGDWLLQFHLYDATLNPSTKYLAPTWTNFYKAINIYNTVIGRAPEVIDDQQTLDTILAEARFLRAFVYFQLVQIWGDVHLTLEETSGVELEANRTPVSEIFSTAIIPDLDFAMANLSTDAEVGRATVQAAKGIRARVAMVQQDWATAETLTKSLINDYSFSLMDSYRELWSMDNEQNSETIWSIQFSPDPLVSHENGGVNYFTPWYTKNPGTSFNVKDGQTWVGYKPTSYFYSLWDKSMDRRYFEGLQNVYYDTPGAIEGDTIVYYSIDNLTDAEIAARPYTVYDVELLISDDSSWPQPTKVRDESRPNFGVKASRDLVMVRLADIYLVLVEALFHQGKTDEAVTFMNTLRSIRAIDGQEAAMEITIAELDLDFILDERARELFAEGRRWFVLKRLGLLVDRVRQHNIYGAADHIQEHHNLRPIPLEQIDRSGNDYAQNPGY